MSSSSLLQYKYTIPIDNYFIVNIEEYEQYNKETQSIEYIIYGYIHYQSIIVSLIQDKILELQTIHTELQPSSSDENENTTPTTNTKTTNTTTILSDENIKLLNTTLTNLSSLGEFRYKIYSNEYILYYNDNLNALPNRINKSNHNTNNNHDNTPPTITSDTNIATATTTNNTVFYYQSILERLYNHITEDYTYYEIHQIQNILYTLLLLSYNASTTIESSLLPVTIPKPIIKGLVIRTFRMYLSYRLQHNIPSTLSTIPNTSSTIQNNNSIITSEISIQNPLSYAILSNILLLVQGSGKRIDELSNATIRLMNYYTYQLNCQEIWSLYRYLYLPLKYTTTNNNTLIQQLDQSNKDNSNSDDDDNDTVSETIPMYTTITKILSLNTRQSTSLSFNTENSES